MKLSGDRGILNNNEDKEIIPGGAEKSETVKNPNPLIHKPSES